MSFGYFSVEPAQVQALEGANFGRFINRLLDAEVAAHDMTGTTLETTYRENIGDGGVDARLRAATKTKWIPFGDSAWQFKAGDLAPKKCKEELKGASFAIDILRSGGCYRLVLGKSLNPKLIERRREQLVKAVIELDLLDAKDRINVISADSLARWIEEFPALAVNPLLGHNNGASGMPFERWKDSKRHQTFWVNSIDRDTQIDDLRGIVTSDTQLDVHVEGVSGLGKTRLVLEAFRKPNLESLVVYFPCADDNNIVSVLNELQNQSRTAIVVIDECDSKHHEIFAQILPSDSSTRLITIGEPSHGRTTRTPAISLKRFDDEAMQKLLRSNCPNLWSEAGRVVVQVASGNIGYALKLSQTLIDRGPRKGGSLVTEKDLLDFFVDELPKGPLFLASCALALFSRFGVDGVDGEVAQELDTIATSLGLNATDLRDSVSELQRQGLLSKQGRYRSVSPHPVAVYFAEKGWERFGQQIVSNLLPNIGPDLTERLFRRAEDIGDLGKPSPVIPMVLSPDGPLASLDALSQANNSALLVHFAIIAPDIVTCRLANIIESASEQDLHRRTDIRRDLVWTLEKLAWHSQTFTVAADALLRLALAENEAYRNNASGTWIDFFQTMLPGTAATPEVRMAYLRNVAESKDARFRLLAVRGANKALDTTGSILVSGENQGGVVVEPRGHAPTLDEAWKYQNSAIDVLGILATDLDETIAREARKYLVNSIRGHFEMEVKRDHLGNVIARLPTDVIQLARIKVQELYSLFDRMEVRDGPLGALGAFEALLPEENANEHLTVLANARPWERKADDLASELAKAAKRADIENPIDALLELLLRSPALPSAYTAGSALRLLGLDFEGGIEILGRLAGSLNDEALVGFLHSLLGEGDATALDRYIDGAELSPSVALRYSVRGDRTCAAVARVNRLVHQVDVTEGAQALAMWMRDADQADTARLLRDWNLRIENQSEYNAVVGFTALQVFQKSESLPALDPVIVELVARRQEFPKVGWMGDDWSVLAGRQVEANPLSVVRLLADLIEADAISTFSEQKLLQDAVQLGNGDAWRNLMNRIEGGEQRLWLSVREWLGNAVSVDTAKQWVGGRKERARILANVTKPNEEQLSVIATYLLEEFGTDERVSSRLYNQFISGSWTGNESVRITSQIAELQGWTDEPGQPEPVKAWCREVIAHLTICREQVLQEEEEDW